MPSNLLRQLATTAINLYRFMSKEQELKGKTERKGSYTKSSISALTLLLILSSQTLAADPSSATLHPGDTQPISWLGPSIASTLSNRDLNLNYNLYVMNYDGSDQTRLTTLSTEGVPAWSPDGSQIAFVGFKGNSAEIYVMKADGSDLRRLTFNINRDLEPLWSPDGMKIAFLHGNSGSALTEVYVMNADGINQTQLTSLQSPITYISWQGL